jgi:hypothetical protein
MGSHACLVRSRNIGLCGDKSRSKRAILDDWVAGNTELGHLRSESFSIYIQDRRARLPEACNAID